MRTKSLLHYNWSRRPHYLSNIKFKVAVDDIFTSAYNNTDLHEPAVLPEREHAAEPDSCAVWHHSLRYLLIYSDVDAVVDDTNGEHCSQDIPLPNNNEHRKHWELHSPHIPDVPLPSVLTLHGLPHREAPEAKFREKLQCFVEIQQYEDPNWQHEWGGCCNEDSFSCKGPCKQHRNLIH